MSTAKIQPTIAKVQRPRGPFVTPIILKAAARIGASVVIEPEFKFVGHITFANGKTAFFRNAHLSINSLGSVEIAKDKGYASFFLSRFGYPVPEGQTFFNKALCRSVANPRGIDDGYSYAQSIGFPVIVKPNSRSRGLMVTRVHSKKEYYRAARAAFRVDTVILVQRYCPGKDYRIVVLDKEVISAYERRPLTIVGDGTSTISHLISMKQQNFRLQGRDTIIDADDFRITFSLDRMRLTRSSVVAKGRHIQLLDNANLSTGGDAVDVTHSIHEQWVNLATNIAQRMCLRLCGVDVLAETITSTPKSYVVLEVNGAPGLDNYAAIGRDQARIVEKLYEKVLLSLERGQQ